MSVTREQVVQWAYESGLILDNHDKFYSQWMDQFATLARADLSAKITELNIEIQGWREGQKEDLGIQVAMQGDINQLRQQLAESQAREEKLRDALENHSGNYKLSKGECEVLNAIVDQPSDDSALREYGAKLVERIANSTVEQSALIGYATIMEIADKIREGKF